RIPQCRTTPCWKFIPKSFPIPYCRRYKRSISMKRSISTITFGAATVALIAQNLWAHPGHGATGWAAGAIHPFTGIDHLAAMLAVGMWAAQQGKRAAWLVPLTFVAMMVAGAAWALGGMPLLMVEAGITTSVLVFGLLIVFSLRMPVWAGMIIAGLFAAFHGSA